MTGTPVGFSYTVRGAEVVISHHGRRVTVLRGAAASRFLAESGQGDPQHLMTRATGNYQRGNERAAARHPRNCGR